MSIGVAVFPADGTDAKTLIANADAALYQAKSEVRGSVRFFEAKLGSRLRERRELQIDLRTAFDRGDLLLHYQPQKTIAGGKVIGFEALVRWQCPKRGMVPPEHIHPDRGAKQPHHSARRMDLARSLPGSGLLGEAA